MQLKHEELRNEVLFSKDKNKETAWHNAAEGGDVEVLNKLLDWAKELQLKPEELRNEVFWSKNIFFEETAWDKAENGCHVEVLNKLWDLAIELHLKPEVLGNEVLLSKTSLRKRPAQGRKRDHFELLNILWDWVKNCR